MRGNHRIKQTNDSIMGARTSKMRGNTDDEEMSLESAVTDAVEVTEKTCGFGQDTENEKSLPPDAEGEVGIQERKMAKETRIPLISSLQIIRSQKTLAVSNTEHSEAHEEYTDGGISGPFNTPTSLQPDTAIEGRHPEPSHDTPVLHVTNTFAESKEILETLDAKFNSLLVRKSPSDANAKLELPFNHDIHEMDKEGYTPLYKAAIEGHLEGVNDLISRGANPNKPSKDGLRPLHAAAQEGHAHIVDFLILQGADVGVECDLGQTPLHTAASHGYTCIIDSLIAEGANVNKEDNTGWTPFNAAVQHGHLEAVKCLMTIKGAKQNRYADMTPLYAAAVFGHIDLVKYFISKGADVNQEDEKGIVPLQGAALKGDIEIMKYLIQQGSDVNKGYVKGRTPFNIAVQYGHLEAVKYLITQGAKRNRYASMTPLYAAAKVGNLDLVKYFISKGADVNEEHDEGKIPLHGAACNGHIKVMEYLIQQGSDVNKKYNTGQTPFNAAVQYGHLEAVKYLVTKGAKQNIYADMTPLYAAAVFGHLHLVIYFISKEADVNQEDEKGKVPLHGAACKGHVEVMEYLIQQGSDVNKSDAEGWTPFNAAVQGGHLEAVEYLMSKGAKQNRYDGMTPLYAAAYLGHLAIVKFLISIGADVDEEDDKGNIPLHGATLGDHIKVMEYLIQQCSDVNKKYNTGKNLFNAAVQYRHLEAVKYLETKGAKQNRYADMTPLYEAAVFGHLDLVIYFISKGADVNEEDENGKIPLHGAVSGGHIEVMEYLIQQGSDVNKNDCSGWTPLHAATKNGLLEGVKLLMEKGAKITRLHGMSPLYISTQYDHVDVVNFLVSSGCDVNERNECGKSSLHAACCNGNMDIVKLLVHHNANVNEQDNDGWTPLEAAAQEGHQDIVNYLTLNGADMHVRDIDGLAPLRAAANTTNPHAIEGISPSRGDPEEEETGDPRPGGHHNHITRGYVTVTMRDADTHSGTGQLSPQVDTAEDGNDCDQADSAKRGTVELSLKNLSTMAHDVEQNVGRSNVNECIPPRKGDSDAEDAGDRQSGGLHYGAKHLATRDYAKEEVVKIKDADTQSRAGKLSSQVDNAEDVYDCAQADNSRRGADEPSLKSLPTRTKDDEKGDNEEHNPFIHAKLKYPGKGEQDPMLNQMEAITCPGTRKRDTITNDKDCSSPRGPPTGQYSGFDPPNLQTMETDGHPSEEPESRCHSLIDENREIKESSSPMNAGNDPPINRTSESDSFPTQPPDVVHQKLYDRNPVSTHGTSSKPLRKIRTKRQKSVHRCPSILAQTFSQTIVALAIILAESPILVTGSDSIERVTLQAGKPGVVSFLLPRSPSDTSQVFPYYTLGFQSEPHPFSINGQNDIAGFKVPSQLRRFTTSVTDLDTSPCVNLMIDNVDTLDEDGYVLMVVRHNFENVRYETILKKEVDVQIPPGRAKCLITFSGNVDYPYEVRCHATTGSVATTLSCYQDDRKIDLRSDITDNGLITRGIFLLLDYSHFSCCSHDVTSDVSETTCNDFVWPHSKETTKQTLYAVPTLVTTPTPQTESHSESGGCRQFMLPPLWHLTYLFVYLLYVFTIH